MLLPKWLAMTLKTSPAKLKSLDKKQPSIKEIVESLKGVGDDVEQIVKLSSKENVLVEDFFAVLKDLPQQMFSIAVSTSELPIGRGSFTQAHIDSVGHLILTSEDGRFEVMDLSESRNRDLMMAVVGDIVPKFKDFASQIGKEKLQKPPQVQEISPPEPLPTIPVEEEVPVDLPKVEVPSPQEKAPVELATPEVKSEPEEVPVSSVDEKAKIEEITAETLKNLETLGSEVFNQSPVSVYFDDWLVHLRQVILVFESSDVISVDEDFTDEREKIFSDIEEELANRLLKEAELEASAKTLAEKKHILGKIDAEYAAQAKYLTVRGKSAMDFLIKNVQRLEEELVKIQQTKTLNPIKRIAQEKKRYDLTQKLKAAKERLALAAQNSEVEEKRIRDEYEKKKQATVKKVQRLEKEIASKETDGSLKARQAATNALTNAVKSLIQRNTEPSQ
jgi:hypothetical protein